MNTFLTCSDQTEPHETVDGHIRIHQRPVKPVLVSAAKASRFEDTSEGWE